MSTDVDSVTVTYSFIAPIAEAGFGNDTICSGGTVILGGSPTITSGTPPFTIEWSPATDLNQTDIPNPVSTNNDTINYVVTVIDGNGCSDFDGVTVAYNPNGPMAEAGFGDDTICSGGTVQLGGNPTVTGGVAPYEYLWIPDYQLQTDTDANPLTTTHIDTTYVVIVFDAEGCQDIDSVFVDYNPNGPNADAGGKNDTLCTSGTVQLGGSPSAANGVAPYTYLWVPSQGLSDSTIANPLTTVTEDITYVLFVEDAIECRDIDSVFVDHRDFPIAEAGFGNDTICILDEQVLGGNPTAFGGVEPIQYFWSPTDSLNNPFIANPITNYPFDTTYWVQVVDADGCTDIDSVFIEHTNIDVSFLPDLTSDIIPTDVPFINTSTGAEIYEWDFGDFSGISNEENPTHYYTVGGEITVTLIGYTDQTQLCSDTFGYTIVLYPPSEINIPNVFTPNDDDINDVFEIREIGIDEFECVIYNRWGTELYSFDELNNGWDGRNYAGIKVSDGTYYYILQATGKDNKEYLLKGYFELLR